MFKKLNLNNFWEDKTYAKEYESEKFDEKKLLSIEEELGYKLPASYIKLMKNRNGGMPKNACSRQMKKLLMQRII